MNTSEMNLYAQLVKIAGQHAPVEQAEEIVEPVVEAAIAPVIEKIANVTDMSIETLMEQPDFLRGVMDSLSRKSLELESALQAVILPE